MKLHLYEFDLPLRHVFTISRGSVAVQKTLIVELEENGLRGYGEATTNPYYGATIEEMATALLGVRAEIERWSPGDPVEFWDALHPALRDHPFAHCALDQAAHDLWGKKAAAPVYRLWGLNLDKLPVSNYTIGIDTIDKMVAKLQEFPDWPIYKIKLGTEHDLEIIRQLRRHTDAVFRVDANCGWTADETLRNARQLRDLNVEFIEQPLPAEAGDQMRRVWAESALPIIADESCAVPGDVRPLPRLLSRREHQAGQMRRPDAGAAHDRPGPPAGPQGDGGLHDGVHGGHFRHCAAAASAGLRRHGWGRASGPRHRHRRDAPARGLLLPGRKR